MYLQFWILLVSSSASPFSVCSGATDQMGISTVDLSENPIITGTTLTITVEGTPTVDITSGAIINFVVKGKFPVFSVTKDACALLGLTCPIPAGDPFEANIDVDVPATAPDLASVTSEMTITNGDGSSVSCIDVPIEIGTHASSALEANKGINDMENLFETQSPSPMNTFMPTKMHTNSTPQPTPIDTPTPTKGEGKEVLKVIAIVLAINLLVYGFLLYCYHKSSCHKFMRKTLSKPSWFREKSVGDKDLNRGLLNESFEDDNAKSDDDDDDEVANLYEREERERLGIYSGTVNI